MLKKFDGTKRKNVIRDLPIWFSDGPIRIKSKMKLRPFHDPATAVVHPTLGVRGGITHEMVSKIIEEARQLPESEVPVLDDDALFARCSSFATSDHVFGGRPSGCFSTTTT